LEQAEQHEPDRRRDADRLVGRQESDQRRGDAHRRHRDQERVLAADEIAQMTEDERP
jgi:hypothetical protein